MAALGVREREGARAVGRAQAAEGAALQKCEALEGAHASFAALRVNNNQ
jgi:hypothetical protein